MRRRSSYLWAIALVTSAAILGSCTDPRVDLQQWDEIQALQASVAELKGYTGELQTQIDSLTRILQRQDTALRLIVDFTGAQVPAYKSPGG